ncbi:hypothetical protein HDU96_003741 [Phlyctochytrium bullatum]|nr:hypothetical protein HDU96_003741 [Phlyctochytrium bullatum]
MVVVGRPPGLPGAAPINEFQRDGDLDVWNNTFAFGNLAARRGWVGVLERLLKIFRRLPRFSPETLRIAAKAGQLAVVKFLVERCNMFVSEKAYETAFNSAQLEVVRYLLPLNQNPAGNWYDLKDAACSGIIPLFSYALETTPTASEWEVANAESTERKIWKKRTLVEALGRGGHDLSKVNFRLIIQALEGFKGSSLEDFDTIQEIYSQQALNACGEFRDDDDFHFGSDAITAKFLKLLKLLEKHLSFEIKRNTAKQLVFHAGRNRRKDVLEWLFARPELAETCKYILDQEWALKGAAYGGDVEVVQLVLKKMPTPG